MVTLPCLFCGTLLCTNFPWYLWLTISPANQKHDNKYDKLVRYIFFQTADLNTGANLWGNNFYPASIKNDNGAASMNKNV